MESWIYQLDVAVVIALVAGVFGGALALRRRANEGLRDFSSAGLLVVAFLLLHLWGQFRPVPVIVESSRPMTEAEKVPLIKRGIPAEMLENMNVSEPRPFDGSNAGDWSWGEVNRMKGRLAWGGILPRLPKWITIRETDFGKDPPSALAEYNSVCAKQKTIALRKYESGWEQMAPSYNSPCTYRPANAWEEMISRIPAQLRIY